MTTPTKPITPKTEAMCSILIAIRDYNYDHIDELTVYLARQEMKAILACDDYDLNEFFKQFHDTEVTISHTFTGMEQPSQR